MATGRARVVAYVVDLEANHACELFEEEGAVPTDLLLGKVPGG